ncbi:MAG: GIY-YIG nuclease family protein [Nannocystaceae bacterium]
MSGWYVYVLLSEDQGRTYVGVTTDLDRRLAQHNGELPGGAKATRQGRPWTIAASRGPLDSRGEAQRVEHRVKRRRGRRRLELDLDLD